MFIGFTRLLLERSGRYIPTYLGYIGVCDLNKT